MRLIRPDDDEPELLAWWEPLIALARRARLDQPPWAVYLEDFTFRGRVKRSGKPTLWVYQYSGTGLDVMCDDLGETSLFVPFDGSETKGRIVACALDRAMFAARIPFAPLEPTEFADDDYELDPKPKRPRRAYRPRSHTHLRLL